MKRTLAHVGQAALMAITVAACQSEEEAVKRAVKATSKIKAKMTRLFLQQQTKKHGQFHQRANKAKSPINNNFHLHNNLRKSNNRFPLKRVSQFLRRANKCQFPFLHQLRIRDNNSQFLIQDNSLRFRTRDSNSQILILATADNSLRFLDKTEDSNMHPSHT